VELGTFGAVLTYAAASEAEAERYYRQCAAVDPAGPYEALAEAAHRRAARLERTRREGISEMILVPISGLDGERYALNLPAPGDAEACLRGARTLEESRRAFYEDASAVLPVRDVAAILARLARENADNLRALSLLGV